jgi:hypothetical protein
MITKPSVLRAVCATLISTLCATHIAYAQHAPTPARNATPPAAPIAAPVAGLSAAASSVAIAGKLDLDNVITVAGETVKLHAVFSRGGAPVNGASLQFRIDGASVGQGVTGANGATDVPYKLIDGLALGPHTILVTFPGDSKTRETTAKAELKVLKSITSLTAVMDFGSIRGLLRGASDYAFLGNRKLQITRDGATVGTVTTDGGGGYDFKYGTYDPAYGAYVGKKAFTVEFGGETSYLGTTKPVPPPSLPAGVGPHINTNLAYP